MGEYALAVDLGASSGRHILGRIENSIITYREIDRFPNEILKQGNHQVWELDTLYQRILEGLRACAAMGTPPATLGIDTWGVDYVLLDEAGNRIGDAVTYRDARTKGFPDALENSLSHTALYTATGIARQSYNTIYQLMADLSVNPQRRTQNVHLLFIPCYLGYRLTGIARNEYTIASTSGLLNAHTKQWDLMVLAAAGIPSKWLGDAPSMPGASLAFLLPALQKELGFQCNVVMPASHDTASAYLAVPSMNQNAAILSSGTWSLLGIELDAPILTEAARAAGFTNEGGFGGKITFVRNIMGLWILQCIRRQWDCNMTYEQMAEVALHGSAYCETFNASDERFLAPENMIEEILKALQEYGAKPPANDSELLYCVHHSLAKCYQIAIQHVAALTGVNIDCLHVVGGGCQNRTLNQLTADATGLTVIAGPSEATALGNLIAQWIASGEIASVAEARQLVRNSVSMEVYQPRNIIPPTFDAHC